MTYRSRIKYTAEQKKEMWDRWQKGDSLKDIGRGFDRPSSSIHSILSPTGGLRPLDRKRSQQAPTVYLRFWRNGKIIYVKLPNCKWSRSVDK